METIATNAHDGAVQEIVELFSQLIRSADYSECTVEGFNHDKPLYEKIYAEAHIEFALQILRQSGKHLTDAQLDEITRIVDTII